MPSCVVIGAGPGGYDAAIKAAEKGFDVTLIEKDSVGGTCLNWGCIPTKALYDFAVFMRHQHHYQSLEIVDNKTHFSFAALNRHKQTLIENEHNQLLTDLNRHGIKFIQANAEFLDEHTIIAGDESIYADVIILALGATSKKLPFNIQLNSSKELLDLDVLPPTLTIIGAGVIGCEFANIFDALGVDVTLIDQANQLLSSFEAKATKRLLALMKRRGINVLLGSDIKNIEMDHGYKTTLIHKNKEILVHSDQLLSATGRNANVTSINLDKIGIQYDQNGIFVNEFYQTNIGHIYAIGDVVDEIQLAHKASYDAMIAVNHITGNTMNKNTLIPKVVYTFPMIAEVGTKEGAEITHKHTYRSNAKAKSIGEEDGYIEWGIKDNILISAVIIGYDADLLIHECSVMIGERMTIEKAQTYIHAHPSFSEIIGDSLKGINR